MEKKKLVEGLSAQKFDDGLFKTIGSTTWKELIAAASLLYENEKTANEGKEPTHCVLCHQTLTTTEKSLFEKYWEFLDSRAEAELVQLNIKQTELLETLQNAKTTYPEFLITDAGIKILTDDESAYLTELKSKFAELSTILDDWILKIGQLQKVDCDNVPTVDLDKIDTLVTAKTTEESNLTDPSVEIAGLTKQLVALKHKKAITAVKESALIYLSSLRWLSKTSGVSFSASGGPPPKKPTLFDPVFSATT